MKVWRLCWFVLLVGVMMVSARSAVAEAISEQSDNIVEIALPNLSDGARPLRLVLIPSGRFQMGSDDDASWSWCHPCEQPIHSVSLRYYFYMGETEITQAQWEAVMGSNPSRFSDCGEDCPVENVSWDMCQEFIEQLNALDLGYSFRLPSEAEWEYAARAGTSTRYSFGNSDCSSTDHCTSCELDKHAWWCANADGKTHEVASKLPNRFGLYDMYGNVWEWCEDDWHDNYTGAPTDGSVWVDDPRASHRVLRGGSWYGVANYCRSADRYGGNPPSKQSFNGFRLVVGQL